MGGKRFFVSAEQGQDQGQTGADASALAERSAVATAEQASRDGSGRPAAARAAEDAHDGSEEAPARSADPRLSPSQLEEDERAEPHSPRRSWQQLRERVERLKAVAGPVGGVLHKAKSSQWVLVAVAVGAVAAVSLWFRVESGQAGGAGVPLVEGAEDFPHMPFREASRTAVTTGEAELLLSRNAGQPAAPDMDESVVGIGGQPQVSAPDKPLGEAKVEAPAEVLAGQRPLEASGPAPVGTLAADGVAKGRVRGLGGQGRRPVASGPMGVSDQSPAALSHGFPLRRRYAAPGRIHQAVGDEKAGIGDKTLPIAVASRIPAVVDMGISSARHGTVLARTTEEFRALDGTVLAQGTVLTGRSSNGTERVFVDFDKLVVGGKQYAIKAVACSGERIGLPAVIREQSVGERTSAKLAEGAIDTLKGVASAAAQSLSGGIIRGTDGVLDETKRQYEMDRSVQLEVPAGTRFEIVITGS